MKLISIDSSRHSASIDTTLEGQSAFSDFCVFLKQISGFWGLEPCYGSKMKVLEKTASAIRSGIKCCPRGRF